MSDWLKYVWWRIVWVTSQAAMLLGWSLRIEGIRNIPSRGPVLVIANHQSFLDPTIVGVASRRQLSYLARKSLFRFTILRWLIYSLNGIPIDQEGIGKEGIKTILGQLQAGRGVVVYPEGERTLDGRTQSLKPGIVLLIKRVQAPIVPIGIAGAFEAWPRTQRWPTFAPLFLPVRKETIAVCVGEALDGRHYSDMPRDKILGELLGKIQEVESRAEALRRK